MEGLLDTEKERKIWRAFGAELANYIGEQDYRIGEKEQNSRQSGKTGTDTKTDESLDKMIEHIVSLKDLNVNQLNSRRQNVDKASVLTFMVVFIFGLLLMSVNLMYVFHRLKLERFKTNLVSMVSHEFSNALNIIQGAAYVLEKTESEGPSERRGNFFSILKSNIHLLSMAVNNLLDLGRLESGRFLLHVRAVDLVPIINECVKSLEFVGQRKLIKTKLDVPARPVFVRADADTMFLVMSNLISNALKYTPDNGEVRIGVTPAEGIPNAIVVSVEDSGIGISPEDQKRVFSGFYRAENGKMVAKGIGLGLTIVKQIVDAHGSSLELVSAVGQGARFSFVLPMAEADARGG